MHIIRIDIKNNRCFLDLTGTISVIEAEEIKQKLFDEVEQLSEGFFVINNISKMIEFDERAGVVLQEILKHLVEKGIKKIIRIVGLSKKGLLQFAKHTPKLEGVEIIYLPSMVEANEYLNNN